MAVRGAGVTGGKRGAAGRAGASRGRQPLPTSPREAAGEGSGGHRRTCCTPTVNHRPASPDKAQKQALAPLAWALTALALVYRLYRLHTRQKYEQQEPVWPPAALRTAPGAQPLHALRGRGGRLSPLGEASSAARAGKAARIHPCPPRGLASAAQKWPASVRPALVSVRDGRKLPFARFAPCQLTFPAMCGEEPTTPRMGVFILVDNTT